MQEIKTLYPFCPLDRPDRCKTDQGKADTGANHQREQILPALEKDGICSQGAQNTDSHNTYRQRALRNVIL